MHTGTSLLYSHILWEDTPFTFPVLFLSPQATLWSYHLFSCENHIGYLAANNFHSGAGANSGSIAWSEDAKGVCVKPFPPPSADRSQKGLACI